MSQPPARPWFRLASMVRPAPAPPTRPPAPQPVQQQTFRTPVALPPAPIAAPIPPRTSAPPSPVPRTTPAPTSSTAASPVPRATAPPSPPPPRATAPPSSPPPRATVPTSPPPPRATAPPSPAKTPLATLTSPANHSPKSPAKTGDSQPAPSTTKSPTTTPAPPPPPPISSKPASPITKPSSPLPASPAKKASPTIAAPRPDVSHSFLPPSPQTQPSAPPPSPLLTSPAFKTVPSSPAPPQPSPVRTAAAPTAPVTARARARATTPIASPKIDKPWVETPPQAATDKLPSQPPSPLTLPSPQLKAGSDLEAIPAEVEQKTVLLQETQEKSKTPPKTSNDVHLQRSHGEAHEHNSVHRGKRELKKDKGVHTHKKHSDSEEFGIRVVTLAGENKGAIMEMSPSRKKYGAGAWSINGQKLMEKKSDEGGSTTTTNDEKHKAAGTETGPMDAFINCNVQGVNNSILYNCAFSHNDPGVHLSVSRKGNGGHAMK